MTRHATPRPWRGVLACLAAGAVALPLQVLAGANPAAGAGPPTASACGTVELAPVLKDDRTPEGKKIKPAADRRGVYVPIILVPDWTGQGTHDAARTGDFSALLDLTAAGPAPAKPTSSLIGTLQQVPGAAVYTFDYRGSAGRWVDDPGIGPALGDAIDCLTAALRQKAILITHGLGGVAARYAVAGQVAGRDRGAKVSTVIGYGSPQLGSQLADLSSTAVGRTASEPRALLRLLLGACNALAPAQFDPYAPCGFLPQQATALGAAGGTAYRANSAQQLGLLPYPATVALDSFAGDVALSAPQFGWFGLRPFRTEGVSLGDLAASTSSVTAASRNQLRSTCAFTLEAFGTGKQSVGLRLIDAGSPQLGPSWGAVVRPCYAPGLPRVADFAASVITIVTREIRQRQPLDLSELESVAVPGVCGHPAGNLVAGRLPGIAPGAGEVVLAAIATPERFADFLAFGDLTADGVKDTVAVLKCSDANGPGPDTVLVYDSQATLLGGVGLDRITQRRLNDVYRLSVAKGKARIDWRTTRAGDRSCCPSLDATATITFDPQTRTLLPGKLTSYNEVPPASTLFEAARSGRKDSKAVEPAPAEILDAMIAAHRDVGAFLSFTCFGPAPADPTWPVQARDSYGQSWPPVDDLRHGDRFCLIRLADVGSASAADPGSLSGPDSPPSQERYALLGMEHVGFNRWQAVEFRIPGAPVQGTGPLLPLPGGSEPGGPLLP